MALQFANPEVKKNYEMASEIETDFQVRIPSIQWSGMFSQLTPAAAAELVKQGYNHIKVKEGVKLS